MVTHVSSKFNLPVFWDDEFKSLEYINEPFNDPESVHKWIQMGYSDKITGAMCDMRSQQPSWNHKFIEIFEAMGWKNVGTSYYRMATGTVMPNHSDLYAKYVQLFGLAGSEHRVNRAVVFLENWKSGHYSEVNGVPIVGWKAGDAAMWENSTPHSAANLGEEDRYTLQITGWV